MYAAIGFFLGCLVMMFVFISGLLYGYIKMEIYKAIFGAHPAEAAHPVA